jgi:hypothetical protein
MKKCFVVVLLVWGLMFSHNLAAQNYVMNGDASKTSDECFRLTPDETYKGGSVWYQNLLVLTSDFDLKFEVYLGSRDSDGADGIAFVLQPLSTGVGSNGGGIGYEGISPSVAVEYDTWENWDRADHEPAYDHIAIQKNGDVRHDTGSLAGPVGANESNSNIEDGQWHTTRLTWDAANQTLNIYFDDNLRLSYTGDIINAIFGGNPNVYWGFTGATGYYCNDQDVCIRSLSFAETYCNTPPSPPSPVSLGYAGRTITYSNVSLNGGGNTAVVAPGTTVSIDFAWSYERTTDYCPDCIVQLYWGISGEFSNCFFDQDGYYAHSGEVHSSFTAPTAPGYYYITQQGSLQYSCVNVTHPPCDNAIALITVGTPAPPTITVESKNDAGCGGESSGSIDISVSGGQPPYSYSWTGPDGFTATTEDIADLAAGTYEVTVSSVCGTCSTTALVEIGTSTDTQNPTITCPADITVNNDPGQCGAVVIFSAPAGTDDCPDAATAKTAGLDSGSLFPIGTTTEMYTVTDAAGNIASCSFTVTVVDNEPLTITCPANITVNNDPGNGGAVVSYTAPVGTDNCSGATTAITGGLDSGSLFPVGTTTETYTVTDAAGNTTSCSFTVTVVDDEAPVITCPADITVTNDPGQCGAVVTYTAPVGTDNYSGATTAITGGLGSGSLFPVGTTTETYTVTDAAGNAASCSFTVTVVDNETPTFNSISASPSSLWPVNHKMVPVSITCNTNDNCDGAPACKIIGVRGNQPINGQGDGNTEPDWELTDNPLMVNLRAERTGNSDEDRIYTITVEAKDSSNNSVTSEVTVTVPHDKGNKKNQK